MERNLTLTLALTLTLTLLLGCGGGTKSRSLSISANPSSVVTLDLGIGSYQGTTLSAIFSDGTTPSNVTWSATQGCIGVSGPVSGPGGVTYQNEADAACNFGCGDGSSTSTITASAEGLTGMIALTCNITN